MKLEGVRVLDLSLFLPGPMLTLMMADHGADVIKIEPPGEGEPTRHIGYVKNGASVWFRNTHRGKRSVSLNLKTPEGLADFHALAAQADVIVEAFRPGVADRLGVGYDAVRAYNPGVVYCAVSAFGQSGAYRDLPAHDVAVQALAGVVSLNQGQDGKPTMPHMPVADALSSLTALSGVLMALLRRQTTGQGDYLDVSMYDATLAWTPNVTGRIFATGQAHEPKAERSWGGAAFYNLYECADGQWIVLGGSELKFARNLLTALDWPDLIDIAARPPGPEQEPLRAFLRETFRGRTRAEWEDWFQGRDICFAPVRTLKDAFDDPATTARGMLARDAEGNEVVGTPILFREEPARIDPALPPPPVPAAKAGWR
ncbi:MAG: CoA transferase [Brevundimonas sp.]|uniref:CaiB/BaiF CoA transferase family protein n=1 Tax=Brevundimonas sp. TaxID=1871086 RepID=UPI0025BC6203|nr:CoA transferase [Brevundimonas sp.]MBX3478467.1 CoA transferase [Brevundimonas sp.]